MLPKVVIQTELINTYVVVIVGQEYYDIDFSLDSICTCSLLQPLFIL